MSLGNFAAGLADVGYMNQGAQQAQQQEAQTQLSQQSAKAGQYGLEDLQRQQQTQQAARDASAAAAQSGKTNSASLLDMAKAVAPSDPLLAQKYVDAHTQLENSGAMQIVHQALSNPTPGPRPDIEATMKNYQRTAGVDPGSVNLDDTGNLNFTQAGQKTQIPVGKTALLLGMVSPITTKLAPGETAAVTVPGPGGGTNVLSNPKYNATREGAVYQESGAGATGQPTFQQGQYSLGTIQDGGNNVPVSFDKSSGKAFVLGQGGPKAEVKVVEPKNPGDPTFVVKPDGTVYQLQQGSPGTPGKKATLLSDGTPATPATSPSLVPIGGQGSPGATAPPAAAPTQGAAPPNAAPAGQTPPTPGATFGKLKDGTPVWSIPDPQNPGKVLISPANGTAQTPAQQPSGPKPKPAPAEQQEPVTASPASAAQPAQPAKPQIASKAKAPPGNAGNTGTVLDKIDSLNIDAGAPYEAKDPQLKELGDEFRRAALFRGQPGAKQATYADYYKRLKTVLASGQGGAAVGHARGGRISERAGLEA